MAFIAYNPIPEFLAYYWLTVSNNLNTSFKMAAEKNFVFVRPAISLHPSLGINYKENR
ncbi:hypothetical protein [Flavobacterium marginilacus]|uniref:hypothetical protein n=1 Tax=Flavobacterium marginilacus TaxID=3003256 RepID=UPI00248E1B54|nr:hypothetical protein [Flavobacterium marginilacus]